MSIFTLLPLLVGGAQTPATPPLGPPDPVATEDGAFERLVAEYRESQAAWDELDAGQRSTHPEGRPARRLWPRFESLADGGEGRALVWMIRHARERGLGRAERRAVKPGLYQRIFSDHLDAPWLLGAVSLLAHESRDVEDETVEELLRRALKEAARDTARNLAQLKLAERLTSSKDAEKQAAGERLLDDYLERHLSIGATAIDFEGATVDGHPFKLSDYRDKVVVLDFYGFW